MAQVISVRFDFVIFCFRLYIKEMVMEGTRNIFYIKLMFPMFT